MTKTRMLTGISAVKQSENKKTEWDLQAINGNILFILLTLVLTVLPQVSVALKMVGIPLLFLWMFWREEFYLLLFPVCLFESVWGQLFAGRIGILTVYLLLLIFKFLYDKNLKIPVNHNLIPVGCVLIYGVYAFVAEGANEWLRLVIYVFFACCILWYVSKSEMLKKSMLMIVLLSALANGLTMALALNGGESIIEGGEAISFRVWGLGLVDPNYSSFICCLGVAIALNLPRARWSAIISIASLIIFAIGIFRSGSRAGLLCFGILLIIKLIMTGGLGRKLLYIAGFIVVAFIILKFVVPNLEFVDWTLARFSDLFAFISGDSTVDITGGRTDLFAKYIDYIFNQDFLSLIFGFNVLQSKDLYGAVGVTHATHNTYLDYILAFGLIGFVLLWTTFIIKAVNYFKKKTPVDNALFMMKLTGLIFAASLSFASRIIWWFLVFI